MSDQDTTELELEIGHILFIDIVGYSKLSIDRQRTVVELLNSNVRQSAAFKTAEAQRRLTRLPTGDGMALVFFGNPESPVKCAMEIARGTADQADLKLRMGIHSGPVSHTRDVNDNSNLAGTGINVAQRVVACGDAGHILLSKHAAEDLANFPRWQSLLHDLGECEVKHGVKLQIVNLFTKDWGNPELPVLLQKAAREKAAAARQRRRRMLVAGTAAIILLATGLTYLKLRSGNRPALGGEVGAPSRKSIAVLPFQNLNESQTSYFADGIQDEILTRLAKVSDLKVISRTSVMQYRAGPKTGNLREVAQSLGVTNILEGSVEQQAGHVRVRAQLIEASTDTLIWADQYDRNLADIFAIQTEISEKVVAELKARLSPAEKAAIQEVPTKDLVAYEFYIRGKELVAATTFNSRGREDLVEGAHLLQQAVEHDPTFFQAYYQLARAHDQIYLLGADHSTARLAMAEIAVEALQRLRPDAGETHAARAAHLYWGYRDYDGAKTEVELARRSLPNDPLPLLLNAYIQRREGLWNEANQEFDRALALDPQNVNILRQIAVSCHYQRRFADMSRTVDRALAVNPNDAALRVQKAEIELDWRAEPGPLRQTLNALIKAQPELGETFADTRLHLAMCEGNFAEGDVALAQMTPDGCSAEGVPLPKNWCAGCLARARKDLAGARREFEQARIEAAELVRKQPDYPEAICVLGLLDAGLNRKEDAIREGRRAVELLPLSKDAIDGSLLLENLAIIYAWTGEADLAIAELKHLSQIPSGINYGSLRLDPDWSDLRRNPDFEAIVQSMAPVSLP